MNYGEIKAAFTHLANRRDMVASIGIYMPLALQRIYYGEQNTPALRVSAMLETATSFTLPDDWIAMKRVDSGEYTDLEFIPYADIGKWAQNTGLPYGYSIDGDTISIGPGSASPVINYRYYAKFPELVNDEDENWLSINAPNVYLSSLLIEVSRKTDNPDMFAKESANYTSTVRSLMSSDAVAQRSGATLRMTPGILGSRHAR